MPEPIKILCAILTTYERQGWVTKELAQFVADFPLMEAGYAARFIFCHNFMPAAAARNVFSKQSKDMETDWLCLIDNDMVPPSNLFDTIKGAPEDAGIVVPVFYCWDNGGAKLTLCWGLDKEPPKDGNGLGHFTPGFHELSKCGTGVIFIRPWVFNKIAYPYFTYVYNGDAGMAGTEDIQFCLKAREAGVKIYGRADIGVGHFHSVDLSVMAKLIFDRKELDKPEEVVAHSAS